MFAPQTDTAREEPPRKQANKCLCTLRHSRIVLPIALCAFPGLPIFLRRQFNWTSLVRLSDPCVAGGSSTNFIESFPTQFCKAVLKDGVSTHISDEETAIARMWISQGKIVRIVYRG